jgi:hypothetical protein
MQSPHTAKPHTGISGAGLRNFEQLGCQLNSRNSEPPTQKQGLPAKLQIILVLWSFAALVVAGMPR